MPLPPPALHAPRLAFPEMWSDLDPLLFFCVEGAPDSARTTSVSADGGLSFRSEVEGIVAHLDRDELSLRLADRTVRLRYHLPSVLDLTPMLSQRIRVSIVQRYVPSGGRATIDAQIWDERGRMLMWALDGRPRSDWRALGLRMRILMSGTCNKLAVRDRVRTRVLHPPAQCDLELLEGTFRALCARCGDNDVALVLVRK